MRVGFWLALSIASLVPLTQASETEATEALDHFIAAFNAEDIEAVRDQWHFPNVSILEEGSIATDRADLTMPFEAFRAGGWARSEFGEYENVAQFESQVHVVAPIARFNADGDVIGTARAYYVLTNRDGQWGIQGRVLLGEDAVDSGEVRQALERFFDAWNRADNEAIRATVNFPHAFLIDDRVVYSATQEDMSVDFDRMRRDENWAKSTYADFEILHRDATRAIASLTFHRHDPENNIYRSVPVVWVFTQRDGKWAVQLRAIP